MSSCLLTFVERILVLLALGSATSHVVQLVREAATSRCLLSLLLLLLVAAGEVLDEIHVEGSMSV